MIDKVNARISKIAEEAESLVFRRSEIHSELEKIEVRLAHLVGAMRELDLLKRNLEDDETKEN